MAIKHFTELGEPYKCITGTSESFIIRHLQNSAPRISVAFSNALGNGGSVFLSREKVEELATTLLFWLDQTDPNKEE